MPAYIKFDGIDGDVEAHGPHVRVFDGADSLVFEAEGAAAPVPTDSFSLNYTRVDAVGRFHPIEAPDGLTADPPDPDMAGFVGGWGSSQYQYAFEG